MRSAVCGMALICAAGLGMLAGGAVASASDEQVFHEVSPGFRLCQDVLYRPNRALRARTFGLEVRGTTCRRARAVALGFFKGAGAEEAPRPLGYRCRFTTLAAGPGAWTCVRRGSTVRWFDNFD